MNIFFEYITISYVVQGSEHSMVRLDLMHLQAGLSDKTGFLIMRIRKIKLSCMFTCAICSLLTNDKLGEKLRKRMRLEWR